MKRRYVAMISAVLCSAMILSACGNSKKTESIYTGDKTEVPAWQANLDAISPSAYADVEGLDLEPGTYISVIGRAGGTPYWDEVKKGVEQAAEDLNESLGYSGDDKIKVVYNAPDENDNIDEMVNILDEELARYPDVIAVSSIDESASEVQFDLATANGIPIVAFDSGNSYQGIQCICRTDNKEAAKTGVKKLCEAIGDSGEIALLLNDSVSENGKEREAGVKEEIKANHPDVSVVETIYVDELDQLKRKAAAEQLGMSAEDLAAAEAGEKMDDAAQTTGTANGSGTDTAETSANGDFLLRDTGLHEFLFQVVINIGKLIRYHFINSLFIFLHFNRRVLVRRRQVAKHKLGAALLFGLLPNADDIAGTGGNLAVGVIGGQRIDEPHIQRQLSAVVGDTEHIVHPGVNAACTDSLGPFRKPPHHLLLKL